MRLLGIETSCDDTAAAVVVDGYTVQSNVLASQDEFHREYGGIVPEIASRKHAETINAVIELALRKAGVASRASTALRSRAGPGLPGSLVVGVAAAQAIAFARDLPAYAVNHLHGHLFANYLENPQHLGQQAPASPISVFGRFWRAYGLDLGRVARPASRGRPYARRCRGRSIRQGRTTLGTWLSRRPGARSSRPNRRQARVRVPPWTCPTTHRSISVFRD